MPATTGSAADSAISRKPYPVDFSLTDEHEQAHLLVDDGLPPPPLVLRISNRAGRDMALLADADGRRGLPTADFHHFRLDFRPGTLSARTIAALRDASTAQALLGADAARWQVAVADGDEDDAVGVLFVFSAEPPVLAADLPLTVSLRGFSAAGGAARPTRVAFRFGRVAYAGETEPIAGSVRHAHLYVLHGGRAGLPLTIGFDGRAVVRADGKPDAVAVKLYNPSTTETFGAVAGGPAPSFMLSFDGGDRPGSLGQGDAGPGVVPTLSAVGPAGALVVEHLGHGQQDQRLRWRLALPEAGIPPGGAVTVSIRGIVAHAEGVMNLYLDSFDVPGHANSRTLLPLTRSLLTPDIFAERLEAMEARLADLATATHKATTMLVGAVAELGGSGAPERHLITSSPDTATRMPPPDDSQSWEDLGLDGAVDVSRHYILLGDGSVRPIINGMLGDPLPQATLPGKAVEVGEYRGYPLVLDRTGQVFCYFPQRRTGNGWIEATRGMAHVGESWMAQPGPRRDAAGRPIGDMTRFFRLSPEPGSGSGTEGIAGQCHIIAVGGTDQDPLFVDGDGQLWHRHPARELKRWERVGAPGAIDVNADGVLLTRPQASSGSAAPPSRLYRCQGGSWQEIVPPLPGDAGQRVGGTLLNPIVIAGGRVFRLGGSLPLGPWLAGARHA
ncbi:MAG: hypothetical protein KDH15_13080 [Rhodocyclaceae bacterium]|nr:hypothetical protein [Rhodocyclaceae bacterium]